MVSHIFIFVHKVIFPLLKWIFKFIRKHKLVFYNTMPQLNSNAIFSVNHSCKYDMPYACEAIGRHCYTLVGKQPLMFIDRLFFNISGTVWVDRKNRKSRNSASDIMVRLLKKKANILMFPEGTWNLTPSSPMLPLYWGIIDIACRASVPIVPIVLEYDKDKCYVSFGQCIYVNTADDKRAKIMELTDAHATLRWELWEHFPCVGYDSKLEWDDEVNKRLADYPKLDFIYEQSCIRSILEPEEKVFKPLKALDINYKNAFLVKANKELQNSVIEK